MSDNPLADPLAWRHIKAPSLVELEIMAREEFSACRKCSGRDVRIR